MGVRCFMVHETTRFHAQLRRFVYRSHGLCPAKGGYHNADGPDIGTVEGVKDDDGYWLLDTIERQHMPPKDDPRWPTKCDGCDYRFTDDASQVRPC